MIQNHQFVVCRQIRKKNWGVLFALFLMFSLFSCPLALGELDSPVVVVPDEDGVQRITIVMESYSFSPNHIIVQANKPISILLENRSFFIPHNFVIDNVEMDLHQEIDVSAGETVNLQLLLTTPGRYHFYCDKKFLFFPNHREEGMEGYLEVR